MDILKDFWDWVVAVLEIWYYWLPGSAIAALISYAQNMKWWNPGPRVYIGVLILGFIFSIFAAWRKERVENRDGPQVFMEWDSGQSWRQDLIRFRNFGKSSAVTVRVGDFSWPELYWHNPILIQSLHADGHELTIQPEVNEKRRDADHVGHLGHILRSVAYQNREPLSIDVTFSDANRTTFTRTFYLRAGPDAWTSPGVVVELGKLTMKRD
jgi:hypothetical protein